MESGGSQNVSIKICTSFATVYISNVEIAEFLVTLHNIVKHIANYVVFDREFQEIEVDRHSYYLEFGECPIQCLLLTDRLYLVRKMTNVQYTSPSEYIFIVLPNAVNHNALQLNDSTTNCN